MATGQTSVTGPLLTLYRVGAIGNFSDRQLLDCFASTEGEPAQLAFTTLVERHGPMVLRVCSALLRDPHDAQDAFQATFLVLLRKARDLWVHDSLGPWLHRVARRTALRAQSLARRRRERELRAAELKTNFDQPPRHDPACSVLHEEIDRLPERLRVLVVLCHLEGHSQELAAKTLSLPIGTVKSRLHSARDILRRRLTRRGLAFSTGLPLAGSSSRGPEARCSPPLYESMVRAAARAGTRRAAGAGLVSASATHLFEETIKTMFLTRLRIGIALALLAGCLALGAAAVFAQQAPENNTASGAPAPRGKSAGGSPSGAPHADRGTAPAYIRRSRSMMIERLERELKLAEARLDLTTANVRSNNDPEVLRARKTVETLAGLLARVDAVLVQAVDDFPTIFDFSSPVPNPGARSDQPAAKPATAAKPEDPPAAPSYDAHSLAKAANQLEWARKMHAKGYVSKAELDRLVEIHAALKARIDSDIARRGERVDWAKRMFDKGYVSRPQYDDEVFKYYDAIKARLWGQSPPDSEELLREAEKLKATLQKLPPDTGAPKQQEPRKPNPPAEKPAAPSAKADADWDDRIRESIRESIRSLLPPDSSAKPAPETPAGAPAEKPAGDSPRP